MRIVAAAVALAALASLLSGCSAPTIHERTVSVPPQDYAELNLVMAANETVSYEWSVTGGPLPLFDVHSHSGGPGGPVKEWVHEVNQMGDQGSFTAPAAGQYSLFWDNASGATLGLHYGVTGHAQLDPQYPPYPPA